MRACLEPTSAVLSVYMV